MKKVRDGHDRGEWIPDNIWRILKEKWQDSDWVENNLRNVQNRCSKKGSSLYTGGSISAIEHRNRLVSSIYTLLVSKLLY